MFLVQLSGKQKSEELGRVLYSYSVAATHICVGVVAVVSAYFFAFPLRRKPITVFVSTQIVVKESQLTVNETVGLIKRIAFLLYVLVIRSAVAYHSRGLLAVQVARNVGRPCMAL